MTMSELKVAVIGAGFIGPVHVEALRRLGTEVVGVLDVTPERTHQAAAVLGLPRAFESYDEVLSDRSITCVHVASPNRLHYEHAAKALAAGKHVVVEKPLAMTSNETAKLVAQAAKTNLVAAVNYNLRFYPLCLEARERVRSGALGRVFTATGSYVQDWLLYATDYNWRVLAEEGGQLRAVSDIGTHWLDLITFILGDEVEAVFADLWTVHPVRKRPTGEVETFSGKGKRAPARTEDIAITTDDYGAILLRFRGGARGVLTVSQVTAGRKNCLRYEIAGEHAALAWNSEAPNELWIGHRDEPNQVLLRDPSLLTPVARRFASYPGGHNEGFPDTFKQLYRAVHEAIAVPKRDERPLFATFEDAHREVLVCEAILKSQRTKKWMPVE
jgi:predicted dehydrogenase